MRVDSKNNIGPQAKLFTTHQRGPKSGHWKVKPMSDEKVVVDPKLPQPGQARPEKRRLRPLENVIIPRATCALEEKSYSPASEDSEINMTKKSIMATEKRLIAELKQRRQAIMASLDNQERGHAIELFNRFDALQDAMEYEPEDDYEATLACSQASRDLPTDLSDITDEPETPESERVKRKRLNNKQKRVSRAALAKIAKDRANEALSRPVAVALPREPRTESQHQLRYNPELLFRSHEARELFVVEGVHQGRFHGYVKMTFFKDQEEYKVDVNAWVKCLRQDEVAIASTMGGLLLIVEGEGEGDYVDCDTVPGVLHNNIWYPTRGDVKSVLRRLAHSLITESYVGYLYDYHKLSKMLMARYKCHFKSYPTLAHDCDSIVAEPWIMDKANVTLKSMGQDYVKRAMLKFNHHCVYRGLNMESELLKIQRRVMHAVSPWGRLFSCCSGYDTLIERHAGTWKDPYYTYNLDTIVCREALALADAEMSKTIIFAPCSKLFLTKTEPEEDIYPPQRADVYLRYEPTDPVPPKEVEVYGCVTKVDQVLPLNSAKNVYGAIRKRAAKEFPGDRKLQEEFCREARRDYATIFPTPFVFRDWDDDKFFTFCKSRYGEAKAKRLLVARHEALTEDDAWAELFCKAETYFKDWENAKQRLIWSRTERFLAHHLPFFHDWGEYVKDAFQSDSRIAYYHVGHRDDLCLALERLEQFAKKLESDVSNWDASMFNGILELEKEFVQESEVEHTYSFDLEFCLRHWTHVWGRTKDRSVVYKTDRGRRSGDRWTGSMNSLINILFNRFLMKHCGITDYFMIVLGDDILLGYNGDLDEQQLASLYLLLGFSTSFLIHDTVLDATFCSMYIMPVDGLIMPGLTVKSVFGRGGINYGNHPVEKFKQLYYGACKSMLPLGGHVPIIGAYLRAICDSAEAQGIKPLRDNRWENPYRTVGGAVMYPAMDTYEWFAERECLSVLEILGIEEYITQNITIDDTPYEVKGDYIMRALAKAVAAKVPVAGDTYEDRVRYACEISPLCEEVEKLEKAKSMGKDPLLVAREFGVDEILSGSKNMAAPMLHELFTGLSMINLRAGVELHREYNRMLFQVGVRDPCSYLCSKGEKPKGRVKPKRPVQHKPREQGMLDKFIIANLTPFADEAVGAKVPDDFHYPSVALTMVQSHVLTVDANGYAAAVYRNSHRGYVAVPTSISAGGVIVWHTANVLNRSNFDIDHPAETGLIRTVGGGLRITYESKVDDAQGSIHIVNGVDMISDPSAAIQHGGFAYPNSKNEVQRGTHHFDFNTLVVGEHGIEVPFLRTDAMCNMYRMSGRLADAITNNDLGFEHNHTSGFNWWCVYAEGLTAGSLIEVEVVLHVEITISPTETSFLRPSPAKISKPVVLNAVTAVHSSIKPRVGRKPDNASISAWLSGAFGSAIKVGRNFAVSAAKTIGRDIVAPLLEDAGLAALSMLL